MRPGSRASRGDEQFKRRPADAADAQRPGIGGGSARSNPSSALNPCP